MLIIKNGNSDSAWGNPEHEKLWNGPTRSYRSIGADENDRLSVYEGGATVTHALFCGYFWYYRP